MAGMPPLSGFLGKLLVLDALRAPGTIGWAWTAILAGSLLTIVGFARAGSCAVLEIDGHRSGPAR